MIRTCTAVLVTSLLLGGLVPLSIAGESSLPPVSQGVVATITGIDDHHHMATLTTEEGEVFELPKESLWKVGSKVECDLIEAAPHARLQNCQPWE
jgi:hypothetical protein